MTKPPVPPATSIKPLGVSPQVNLPVQTPSTKGILQRRLGASDIMVSECALGGMTWGFQNTAEDASNQLSLAFDMGVNFVDTAESYPVPISPETSGATDLAIARWMSTTKRARDDVIISTKVNGYSNRYTWFREDGSGTRLTDSQIKESVDGSLKRLGTDYIDCLQFHWPDRPVGLTGPASEGRLANPPVPIAEQVATIGTLLQQGKIRSWGLSNENAEGVREFTAAAREQGIDQPVCVQNAYSLLQRTDEIELLPALGLDVGADGGAGGVGIGYIPYSPLSGGVLSGKYSSRVRAPKRSRLSLRKGYEASFKASAAPAAVDMYVEVARKHGMTPTQLSVAHCNSRAFVTCTIIGATSMTQLAEDLQGFSVQWTQEMEDDVRAVYAVFPDPWRVQVAGMG